MRRASYLPQCIAVLAITAAIPTAQAATDIHGQELTLTLNAAETEMKLYWRPMQDDFSPPSPCSAWDYTLNLYIDGELVPIGHPPMSGVEGDCHIKTTIKSGAVYTNKVSPGVWSVTANRETQPAISESLTINACTPTQGKLPMYRTYHSTYTDNLYTTSSSNRDISLRVGYSDRGVPFAMPNQVRFGSKRFWRYFKGAPQLEHFYTHVESDARSVEGAGYVYEGIEGNIFDRAKPGAVALYRYSLFNGMSGDLQHYYTIKVGDPAAFGWSYEGVVGYVCQP
jgi:hypothetical protein